MRILHKRIIIVVIKSSFRECNLSSYPPYIHSIILVWACDYAICHASIVQLYKCHEEKWTYLIFIQCHSSIEPLPLPVVGCVVILKRALWLNQTDFDCGWYLSNLCLSFLLLFRCVDWENFYCCWFLFMNDRQLKFQLVSKWVSLQSMIAAILTSTSCLFH